jgi:HlyD family secretion protein
MSSAKKKLAAALLVIAVLAGAAYAYQHSPAARNAIGGILAHFLEHRRADKGTLTLYGNVDIREADLGFNDAGRIDRMLVEEGDTVHKGQLLATLDASRYQAQAGSIKAQIAAQEAVLARLLAGSRPEEIKRARADVEAIQGSLSNATAHLRRNEKLGKDRFVSEQLLDDDRDRIRTLSAQLDAANQTLALAVKGPRQEDIKQARDQLTALKAQLALAQEQVKDTRLYAMEDGVVNVRIVEPGTVVQAQTPIYTIALTDPVWVRTYVSETDLGKLRPRMPARIYTDSRPGVPYEGWVGFISPVAEFTPKNVETPDVRTSLVYRLRIYVHHPDDGLRQGMPVTVKLRTGGTETAADKRTQ